VGSAKVLLRTSKSSVLSQGGHLRTIRDGRCAAPPETPLARRRAARAAVLCGRLPSAALYVRLALVSASGG